MNENLPTIAELRAEILTELTCDNEYEWDDCIDAKLLNDRLTVAEAVREACIHALESSVVVGRMRTQEQEDYSDAIDIACSFIRSLDLAEIVKGKP